MTDAMVYVVGLGPGDARYLTAQAQTALQAADVLCGYTVYIDLVRPLYPDKEVYTTGMTKGNRPLPLGAGDCAKRQDGSVGLLRRCGRVRHGQPAAGTGTGLPKRDGGDRARPDGGLKRRRGAGRSIGARFLCDLPFGSAHAPIVIEKRLACAAMGGLLCGTVQPVLQGPGRLSAKGRADLTAKRQGTADNLRHRAQHWP